jgi:hypothetical protein
MKKQRKLILITYSIDSAPTKQRQPADYLLIL